MAQLHPHDAPLTSKILSHSSTEDVFVLPISLAQQRLWLLDQLEPGCIAYNICRTIHLTGQLSIEALEWGLNEIVRRHEALRTTFVAVEGQPVQVITPTLIVKLLVVDLQQLSVAAREAEFQRLAAEEAQRPFNLARGPLVRLTLLRLGELEHGLLLTMHHIVSDGWSMGVFFRELATLYTAYSTGQPSHIPELPIQYADFTQWQRRCLEEGMLESQLAYWRDQLIHLPPLILPTDYPRPHLQTFRGARQSRVLSKPSTDALKALSREEDVTLFMTLLAAFQMLLYRYTGQDDIAVGCPMANRHRTEIEGLIGFFTNTLVLRTALSGNPSFHEVLRRVRDVALGAYAHQDVPFEYLMTALQLERGTSRFPLIQVLFNFPHFTEEHWEFSGLTLRRIEITDNKTAKFDLTFYVAESDGELTVTANYNTDLFEATTIIQMLDHFQTLLNGIVTDPGQRLSVLPSGAAAERQHLITHWQRVHPTNPFVVFRKAEIEQSLADRFVKQVQRFPHNIAVKTKHNAWTYEALNQKANHIAQLLLRIRGAGEERIALLFDHDASMIAALLGALKIGKTYVPLDPTYPKNRLAYVLQDSQASIILTNTKNITVAQLLIQDGHQIINMDEVPAEGSCDDPFFLVSPDTQAYILYTSGSTGQPKGVIQNHRNVLHHIRVYTNNLHICAEDRLTLLSSYSFDAAVMDIFGALLNGATLYPINIKEEMGEDIVQWCNEQEITIYHSTPTIYRYIVNSLHTREALPKLRLIVLGGEEVNKRDVELYKQHFAPICLLVNGLGPTESTVTLQYFIDHHTVITRHTVPVGFPVEDTEIVLLDSEDEPAVVVGEIAIRSPYIALGYWRKPEITHAAFLPDPDQENRRIYRTGDIGRFRPDGTLEFVGRKDHQVKIRGFRIEPGEIEAVLRQHSAVRQAVVLAREDTPDDTRLVAYVVPTREPAPTTSELRSFLQARLPEYMVPPAFVLLDSLPLTPNGKVDRHALPAPDDLRPELEVAYVAPRNVLEQGIAEIWQKLLGIEPVGIHDNFFELGGHSLLAVRLVAHLEKVLGIHLPVALLFQAPTIEQLASILCQDKGTDLWSSLMPIHPGGSKPPFFWIHGDASNAFLPRYLGPEQPFYGLEHQSQDGTRARYTRVETIAKHYLTEICTVQAQGPYFLGGYSFGSLVAFEAAQQLTSQGEEVSLLVLLDPPSLSSGQASSSRIPRAPNGFTRVTLCRDNVRRHWRNLATLGRQEKLAYVLVRVQGKIKASKMLRKVLCKMYVSLGYPLPLFLRSPYIIDIYRKAAPAYVPQPYARRVLLFKGEKRGYDPRLDWQMLLVGELEMHEVPGNHLDMTKELYIQVWAPLLKACLDKAQARKTVLTT
jgi:amino acid adenylation domain-containing protein